MAESYAILKKVIDNVGAKMVASELNVSLPLVYKWCQRKEEANDTDCPSGATNPLDRIKTIYEVTKDEDIINWVCQLAGGYFTKNPESSKCNVKKAVIDNIHQFIKEFSETLDSISASYHDDKKIDIEEAKIIRKEWEDLKRTGESFVKACEAGKFNRN